MNKVMLLVLLLVVFTVNAESEVVFPGFSPGGEGSTYTFGYQEGNLTFTKSFVKIDGVEYTSVKGDGLAVSLLYGSEYEVDDIWQHEGLSPFRVFRETAEGLIYGYGKDYMTSLRSNLILIKEGVADVSFPVGQKEILLYTPHENRFGVDPGFAGSGLGWTVMKFTVKFEDGTKKNVEVIGYLNIRSEMDDQEIQEKDRPETGSAYYLISYFYTDKDNGADIISSLWKNKIWEIYCSKRGIEGITTPYKNGAYNFVSKLVSANLTPEQGKARDIPQGKTATTWGNIK